MDLPDDDPPPAPAAPPAPKNPFDFDSPEPARSKRSQRNDYDEDEPRPRRRSRRDDDDEDDDDDQPRYRRPGGKEDEPPKWLMGIALIPFLLVIVGGLIGGLCGGGAAAINMAVAKQRGMAVGVKLAVFAGTTIAAVVCYVVLVAALLKAING